MPTYEVIEKQETIMWNGLTKRARADFKNNLQYDVTEFSSWPTLSCIVISKNCMITNKQDIIVRYGCYNNEIVFL